jgi:hypothetical protein
VPQAIAEHLQSKEIMSKQSNKVIKRSRRNAYLKRRKVALKTKSKSKAAAAPAA